MTDKDMIMKNALPDIMAAFSLLTRFPVPVDHEVAGQRAAIATWAYPLIGATLGLIASMTGLFLYWIGTPVAICAIAMLGVLAISTGGMHEDGLADCADGFGGASDKENRLEIMKDSRIGAFGAIALGLFLIGRFTTLETLMTISIIGPMIAVGAASRLPMVLALYALPNARGSGLSQSLGKPPEESLLVAILITLAICFVAMGVSGIFVFGWAFIAATIMGVLAYRAIGGQTGDVLGAMQQWAELAALAAAVTAIS